MNDSKSVVFLHVMKCGGTSVRAGLSIGALTATEAAEAAEAERAELAKQAALAAATAQETSPDPHVPEETAIVGPAIFELDGTAAKVAAGGTDRDNWVFRDALLPYVLDAIRPALVLGHFRYRNQYHARSDTTAFVTVLRDPVDRLVSLWKYRRFKEGVDVAVSMTFEEFIASRRWSREGHAYVDTFSGSDEFDPRSDEAVAATIANLRRFAVVGFTDRLDSFAGQVSECLGATVTIPKYNTSPAPDDTEVDADALELARGVCAPDIRVYEEALAFSS